MGILEKARQDVERVKKDAKFLLEIGENGDIGKVKSNPEGNINSLVVIGPVESMESKEQILLLEIGVRRGKPYSTGCDKKKKNGVVYVPPRHKYFTLSESQYCRIASVLFQWLQEESAIRINNWDWKGKPFLKRKKGFQKQEWSEEEFLRASKGICFSASFKKDVYLISDVLWASANNEVRKRFLKWLCELSAKLLCYKKKKRKARETLERLISHRPDYVIEDMLEFLPKEKRFLYNDISYLAGWNQEKTEERRLRDSVLLNPQARVGEIEMRIKRIDKRKGYIVFEVFSPRLADPF